MVTRTIVSAAMLVACVLAASSCTSTSSGPGVQPTASAAASVSPRPTESGDTRRSTPPQLPRPPSTQKSKKKFNLVTWITGLGITGASGPQIKEPFYDHLASRRCFGGPDPKQLPVLSAAMDACRAAVAGPEADSAWWTHAVDVRDTTDRSTLDCIDAMAYELLDVLVDAHLADPELPFEFDDGGELGRPACLVMESFSPSHATNGELVTVKGRRLDRAIKVRLDDERGTIVEIDEKSPGSLQFRLPQDLATSGDNVIILWDDNGRETKSWVPLEFGPKESSDPTEPAGQESPGPESPGSPPLGGGDSGGGVPSSIPEPSQLLRRATSAATTGARDG